MWRAFSKWSSRDATITHINAILSRCITKLTLRVGRDKILFKKSVGGLHVMQGCQRAGCGIETVTRRQCRRLLVGNDRGHQELPSRS